MAKNRPTGSEGKTAPISGHRLFPAVIALWGSALFGLVCALLPTPTIEKMIAASGISALIPAASQPLTFEAHIAIALAAAAIGGWLGLTLARRIAVAQFNALPTSSSRMARITRQAPIFAADSLVGAEFDDRAISEAASLSFVPAGEAYQRVQPRLDLTSEPLTIWGDTPPAAVAGTYGPELPELLLSEEMEAGEESQWQETIDPADGEEGFFEAYVDWPSEPANDYQATQDEPSDASLDAAPLDADGQDPAQDLFNIPAAYFDHQSEFVRPEDDPVAPGIAHDGVEAQAAWEVEPEASLGAEDLADQSEPDDLPAPGGLHQAIGSADEFPSFEAEEDEPVLPSDEEEIGQHAREADWPSTPAFISADLDSFGEPEEEDEIWPGSSAGDSPEDWGVADQSEPDEEDEEEDASILDTTLGAFRDYARDYTGGDDGEEEEEEEEEDDTSSSFGSLLGMTVRRRAADEPIELVGFDGEPVALSDCEIQLPDELENEGEYDSPLLVRRRMGGA